MEFFFAIFFLLFYYIRPQDWVVGLEGANLIQPIVGIWIIALFVGRSRPSPFPGFLRTPHDWVMIAYLGYILVWGDGALMSVLPYLAFYALTLHSVNTWDRLFRYLLFWNGALILVSAIAVASTMGLDLTGAQDNRFTQLGRLAIGTWLHNNPNALCHAIVMAIPLCYILYFWRGSLFNRAVVFPGLAGIAFYCAWLTQSKGGYLVGAGTLLIALLIGRPRWVQSLLVSFAVVGGVSALSFLPRMGEMGDLRSDEGVQGRLIAWDMARTAERSNQTGVGWKTFVARIPWEERKGQIEIVEKATHSSYVQVGADLGRYGLFLYLAGIWCSLHTLFSMKFTDTLRERCRRALLLIVVANIISGWMINRQYHTEYFLMIAAVAAMHRLKKSEEVPGISSSSSPELETVTPGLEAPQSLPIKPLWNRFGVVDFTCCAAMTWMTFITWDYLMRNV